MRDLLTIFLSVLIPSSATTQIATILFATDLSHVGKGGIFLASAGALVVSSAIAVTAGELIKNCRTVGFADRCGHWVHSGGRVDSHLGDPLKNSV